MQLKKIRESIVDPAQPQENPYVWKDKKINPLIRIKIVDILRELKVVYRELTIVGSITGKFWSHESDIDCTVFCDVDEKTLDSYRKLTRVVNERHFFGPFPINFYFRTDNVGDMMTLADGIYDLLQDKWVKEPIDVDQVEEVLKNPTALAQRIAKRLDAQLDDVAKMVQDLTGDYQGGGEKIENRLNQLQLELDDYNNTLDAIHKKRVDEFSKSLEGESLETVRKYKSRNFLPWNIVYKLLVKWLYYKWSAIFRDKLKDDELKKNEVKELFHQFVRYWV
ncbi:MAG: hypothetical protein WC495_06530 [Patescibacteria group bacterium]|jgi:hypothetical protein